MDYYSIGWRDNADGQGQAYHNATDRENNTPMNTQQAKHTPGPWAFDLGPTTFEVYTTLEERTGSGRQLEEVIAVLPGCDDVSEANACLIAAAPQLLEALQACLCALTDETGNVARREADACLQARAAIQSATGGKV